MAPDNKNPGPHIWGRPLSPEQQGRCFTCGFLRLAVPIRAGTDYREMNGFVRLGLEPCLVRIQSDKEYTVQPTTECLIGIAGLPDEIGQEASRVQGDFERAARVVFKKDRECPKWRPYSAGKPMQQYYAEDFMLELERLRQQFQEDWERRQREFEQQLAARDETTQLELAKRNEQLQTQRDLAQKSNAKLATRITVVGLIFGLAQVLTLTKESVLWRVIAWLYHLLSGQ